MYKYIKCISYKYIWRSCRQFSVRGGIAAPRLRSQGAELKSRSFDASPRPRDLPQ